jgi:type I restriction enzyme R subunit
VIDYKDLFQSLERSVQDYTSGAFDDFDHDDVAGLLSNRLGKAKDHLDETLEKIRALCEHVDYPKDSRAYIAYFCGTSQDTDALKSNEAKRVVLYRLVSSLVRAYANIANEMLEAGYTESEAIAIQAEVTHYEKIRTEVKIASGDYIDLKVYEPAMRHLIDMYIQAEDSVKVSSFDNMTLVQLIVKKGASAVNDLPQGIVNDGEAVAETIENNLRRVIIDEHPINSNYYQRMSQLLDALIQQRKANAIEYEDYLARIVDLAKQLDFASQDAPYPIRLNTRAKRALYDNLDQNETLALLLDKEIGENRKDGWRNNIMKERRIKKIITDNIADEELAEKIFELVRNQAEY